MGAGAAPGTVCTTEPFSGIVFTKRIGEDLEDCKLRELISKTTFYNAFHYDHERKD